jgi:hypothetical protein
VLLLLACPAANAGWIKRTDLDVPDRDLREAVNLCAKDLLKQTFEFELFKETTSPQSILFDIGSNKAVAMPEILLPDVGMPANPAMREADLPVFKLASMLKEEKQKPLAAFPSYYPGSDYAAPSSSSEPDMLLLVLVVAIVATILLWILAANQR